MHELLDRYLQHEMVQVKTASSVIGLIHYVDGIDLRAQAIPRDRENTVERLLSCKNGNFLLQNLVFQIGKMSEGQPWGILRDSRWNVPPPATANPVTANSGL